MGILLDILSGIGNTLDVPGSMVRDTLGGENPFDQLMATWRSDNRLSGRDLTRRWGLSGDQDTGLNAAGGVATEMALDPLTWLGVSALTKAFRGGSVAARAGEAAASPMRQAFATSVKPAVAMSIASPVAGAYLMGDNEEGSAWKNVLGTGLMLAPLAMAAGKGAKKLTGWKRQVAEFNAAEDAKIAQRIAEAQTPEEATRLRGLLSTAEQAPALPAARTRHESDFLEQMGFWSEDKKAAAYKALREAGIADATSPQAEPILRAMTGQVADADWANALASARRSAEATKLYWARLAVPIGLAGGGALTRSLRRQPSTEE